MRRALFIAVLSLALPIAAWADGIDLINHFGTASISNAGIFSKGSQLAQFKGINLGHSLGSVSFGTGALVSGSLQAGGIFSSVGSFFNVVGKGPGGQPKGAIFTGAFVGPITWTLVSQTGGGMIYQLSGALAGMLYNGHMVTGSTTQLFHTTPAQLAKGIIHIQPGNTQLMATPEPGTLGLLGLGLVGIAHRIRRSKLSRVATEAAA